MTRKSRREIERAAERLELDRPASTQPALEERWPADVVEVIHKVTRDLLTSPHLTPPDAVVNAPEETAIENYLELVREEYGIEADRDRAVRRALGDVKSGDVHYRLTDTFATVPAAIARTATPTTEDGTSLGDLVDAGRVREAEELLVGTAYAALADRDDGAREAIEA